MYLSQSVEQFTNKSSLSGLANGTIAFRLLVYRVELDDKGRPVWKMHRQGEELTARYCTPRECKIRVRATGEKKIPFMQNAGPGKLVTMKQAETLTGLIRPAALDYLTENVNSLPTLSNYQKPPKIKAPPPAPPKPTKEELARASVGQARQKVLLWERRILHAERKAKEWRTEVKKRERKASKLAEANDE